MTRAFSNGMIRIRLAVENRGGGLTSGFHRCTGISAKSCRDGIAANAVAYLLGLCREYRNILCRDYIPYSLL